MTRTLSYLPLLLVAFGLSACEEADPYLPKVSFKRLDVQSVDWEHASADFVFSVSNPNPITIKLARFDYALALGGVDWLSGDDPDGLVLESSTGSEIALPVDIIFQSLYEMVQATRGDDDIPFGLKGSFGFDTPAGLVDLPYNADGLFPALRTPKFSFEQVRVDELDFASATLGVDLGVDNEHASNLLFQDFDYALTLEGSPVSSGLVDLLADVAGDSNETVTLPVTVDFLDAGFALYDVLSGDKVNVGLSAGTNVDTPFGVVPLSIDETGKVNIGG